MKYLGSKARHAREILDIVLSGHKPGSLYVEPFLGGANTFSRAPLPKLGADIHGPLMAMWGEISRGWTPPQLVTEEDYRLARQLPDSNPLKGYIGFSMSFGGRYFQGYRRDKKGQAGDFSNMATQSRRSYQSLVKQVPGLLGASLCCSDYSTLSIPNGATVYCDPPYANTKGYTTGGFDHAQFWDWCRGLVHRGCRVFVSEYNAPSDFSCVWTKPTTTSLSTSPTVAATERLFTLLPESV